MTSILERNATYEGDRVTFGGIPSHAAALQEVRHAREIESLAAALVELVRYWPEPDPDETVWVEWNAAQALVATYEKVTQ